MHTVKWTKYSTTDSEIEKLDSLQNLHKKGTNAADVEGQEYSVIDRCRDWHVVGSDPEEIVVWRDLVLESMERSIVRVNVGDKLRDAGIFHFVRIDVVGSQEGHSHCGRYADLVVLHVVMKCSIVCVPFHMLCLSL